MSSNKNSNLGLIVIVVLWVLAMIVLPGCTPEKEVVYLDSETGKVVTPVAPPEPEFGLMRHWDLNKDNWLRNVSCLNGYQVLSTGSDGGPIYLYEDSSIDPGYASRRPSLLLCDETTRNYQ